MEYTWTDRNELDRINEQFDEEFYQLQKTVSNIKEIAPSCKIGNIGLYSGNKMRSFYRRYKENNVSYADSKVLRAIETYFMFQYDNAVYALKRFADKMERTLGNYARLNDMRRFILESPDIKEYIGICEEIYNFDLDTNAISAINYVLDETPFFFVLDLNELIDEYNEELSKLQVKEKIEYRDSEKMSMEVPEEELMFLKFIFDEVVKQLSIDDDMDFIETPEQQEIDIQKRIKKEKK